MRPESAPGPEPEQPEARALGRVSESDKVGECGPSSAPQTVRSGAPQRDGEPARGPAAEREPPCRRELPCKRAPVGERERALGPGMEQALKGFKC